MAYEILADQCPSKSKYAGYRIVIARSVGNSDLLLAEDLLRSLLLPFG